MKRLKKIVNYPFSTLQIFIANTHITGQDCVDIFIALSFLVGVYLLLKASRKMDKF